MGRASQVALVVKNPPASEGDTGDVSLIPGSGSSLGGGHGNPLYDSCLENPMERHWPISMISPVTGGDLTSIFPPIPWVFPKDLSLYTWYCHPSPTPCPGASGYDHNTSGTCWGMQDPFLSAHPPPSPGTPHPELTWIPCHGGQKTVLQQSAFAKH